MGEITPVCRCLQIGFLLFVLSCGLFPTCTLVDRSSREASYIAFTVTTCIRTVSAAFTFTSSMVLINLATSQLAGNQIGMLPASHRVHSSMVCGFGFLGGQKGHKPLLTPSSNTLAFVIDLKMEFIFAKMHYALSASTLTCHLDCLKK
jgi:hypothetical protein